MKVRLRNPDREVEVAGGRPVRTVLDELGISADTVLVIRGVSSSPGKRASATRTSWRSAR